MPGTTADREWLRPGLAGRRRSARPAYTAETYALMEDKAFLALVG